jgi:hypothetical protein
MWNLGLLGAAFAPTGDFELIASAILTSNEPSVTFNNLDVWSSTYKHLQIRLVGRTTRSGQNADSALLRINGDTGSNYNQHELYGNGSTVPSSVAPDKTSIPLFRLTASTSAANAFGAIVVDLLDTYSTTKNKTVRYLGGATDGNFIYLGSGARFNTEAISSLSLTGTNGSFVAGSRFSLYGIRG